MILAWISLAHGYGFVVAKVNCLQIPGVHAMLCGPQNCKPNRDSHNTTSMCQRPWHDATKMGFSAFGHGGGSFGQSIAGGMVLQRRFSSRAGLAQKCAWGRISELVPKSRFSGVWVVAVHGPTM